MLAVFFITLMPTATGADFPAEEIIDTLKTRWVHRNKFQALWEKIEPVTRQQLAQAKNDEAKARVIVSLFEKMNDVHSSLLHQGKYYAHYEGVDAATYQLLKPLLERQQREAGKCHTEMLEKTIAYVRVTAMNMGSDQIEQAANDLANRVMTLAKQRPQGWIVDLRINGGGNLYPMLLGLQALLGNSVVGGTVNADGQLVQQWVLKREGLFWRDSQGDRQLARLSRIAEIHDDKTPVVVLVGPVTISSGQAVALAFKHRTQSILLGEPTAKGYCTVNQPIQFGKETNLNLAVGYMADRQGNAYETQVLPDLTVEGGEAFDALLEDRKVIAAIQWLRKAGK
jgi:C-terminal processing protease CtpA/Prc